MTQRICIIKVGSAVVTSASGKLDEKFLFQVCRQLAAVKSLGWKPVLVSSGATAAGRGVLDSHPENRSERQPFVYSGRILAAIGQAQLITTYARFFDRLDAPLIPAQILLTRQALADRSRYTIMRDTLFEMLANDIVPIINNNDVTRASQINFQDNDQVATYLAGMLDADIVVFISDVGGVFDKNPRQDLDARRIEILKDNLWPEILVDDRGSSFGGMANKLTALRMLSTLGISARVASKTDKDVIIRSVTRPSSRFGTRLLPAKSMKASGKSRFKRWLATGAFPTGILVLSSPGAEALAKKADGKSISILGVGVTAHHGVFAKGSTIALVDQKYKLLAVGRTRASSEELVGITAQSRSPIIVHADQMLLATEAAFLGIDVKQLISALVEAAKAEGYSVVQNRPGTGDDHKGAIIRIAGKDFSENRGRKDAHLSGGEVTVVDNEARELWSEAKQASGRFGIELSDWILFRTFS